VNADWVNTAALGLALVGAGAGAIWQGQGEPPREEAVATAVAPEEGATEMQDARGLVVPIRSYSRIVSLNPVADHLLLELVEPERLLAVTDYTLKGHRNAWKFGDRPGVGRAEDMEKIVALAPDLILISRFSDESFMARLREQGIQVFDLGDVRGLSTMMDNIAAIGALLEERERAASLMALIERRTADLEGAIQQQERPWGLYLSVAGDDFLGGSKGSNYADLLRLGGVRDLAEKEGYAFFPRYNSEELIEMAPELLVTQRGMGPVVCGHSVLRSLPACGPGGRVIELGAEESWDSGLGILDEAARLQRKVFPVGER